MVSSARTAFAVLLLTAALPACAYDWLQFNGDPQHSGNNVQERAVDRINVAQLAFRYQVALPAIADGAPVFLESVVTSAGLVDTCAATARVSFDGVPAPVQSAIADRIVLAAPFAVAGRASSQVVVEYQGIRSSPVALTVAPAAPGVFTLDNGQGQAVAFNEDGSANNGDNAAPAGSVLVFYATGLGPTDPPSDDGLIAVDNTHLKTPVTATVGGAVAEVRYAGTQPGLIVSQTRIEVVIPEGAASGNAEVVVRSGSLESRKGVSVSVR